jgi:glycopeptide antibiotics resistance protein
LWSHVRKDWLLHLIGIAISVYGGFWLVRRIQWIALFYPKMLYVSYKFPLVYKFCGILAIFILYLFIVQIAKKKFIREYLNSVAVIYIVVMFFMLFMKHDPKNVRDFSFDLSYTAWFYDAHGFLETILNVLGFIPVGMFLGLRLTGRQATLLGFFISFAIESAQLIFMVGSFAIADMITNTLGVFLGWCVIKIVMQRKIEFIHFSELLKSEAEKRR